MTERPTLAIELAAEYRRLLEIAVDKADAVSQPTSNDEHLRFEACVLLSARYETLMDFWEGIAFLFRRNTKPYGGRHEI